MIILIVFAYLLGSVPFGYLIVKRKKGIDIRTTGSFVTGATNVSRLCGWRWGLVVAILDFLKGFIPTSLAFLFLARDWNAGFVGFFAFLGHVFPIFIKFKGGKGVATSAGVLIPSLLLYIINYPSAWIIALFTVIVAVWIWLIVSRKKMGLASISLMILSIPFFGLLDAFVCPTKLAVPVFLMASAVLIQHRENWKRLWQGKERTLETSWEK
ncbi:MAG: glycerol-3-phosphate 1-O-acyltransferase PlsY [Candidatus Pacebacteria bacterium]|nr:glycerol-3-phosphate 1-O-acyltransferase PlsY [Candidatus Paceibacterota bacterium]